jgi:glycerol kinase
VRKKAEAGSLFGNIDSFLTWHLTATHGGFTSPTLPTPATQLMDLYASRDEER